MNETSELEQLFQLKQEWDSENDDFAKDFFSPCLKYASLYRGESGFFTDSVLIGYSEIALDLVERDDYKVELLTSPNIKERMRVTLEDTLSDEDKKTMLQNIGQNALLAAVNFKANPERRDLRQMLIAYLIASEKFEIQFGIMNVSDPDDDTLLHYKRGYFEFPDKRVIAHRGTGNFTRAGQGTQGNDLQVYNSETESQEEPFNFVTTQVDKHWKNESPAVDVIPVNKDTLDAIKQINDDNQGKFKKKLGKVLQKYRKKVVVNTPIVNPPKKGQPVFPKKCWKHKKNAVKTFLDKKNGLLEMATGTGKTSTALVIAGNLMQQGKVNRVIIAMASEAGNDLLEQWYKEIIEFKQQHSELYKVLGNADLLREFGEHKERDDFTYSEGSLLLIGLTDPGKMRSTLSALVSASLNEKTLIIYDEVHSLASKGRMEALGGSGKDFIYKLGLSATPLRRFDHDKKLQQFLFDEVGEVIYEYGLADAIEDKILCELDYHIINYSLTDDERKELARHARSYSAAKKEKDFERMNNARIQMARVKKTASEKPSALKQFISQHEAGKNLLNSSIIFAGTHDHAQEFASQVLAQLNITQYRTYFEQGTQRKEDLRIALEDLNKGKLQCLVAVGMLSEGIDISSLRTVVLGSSNADIRGTIQKVGRALRTDSNDPKKRATVIDFSLGDDDSESDKERIAFLTELNHVKNK